MTNVLKGIYPEKVFDNFEKISQIPRESQNEKAISDYIFNMANSLGLEAWQDEYHNLVVRKPACNSDSKATVMLQAHMDMVCEASDSSNHDFSKDPIELIVDGNKLHANSTTLGADNGIGVAYMMSIMESNDISHPNLEMVFTASEEIGLVGIDHMDLSKLESKYVINLDSEEDYNILVGCAGAVNSKVSFRKEYKPAIPRNAALEISVCGLFGGHSGMDIDKNRANANIVMGRILSSITYDFDLFSISGGSKRNAIPRNCDAVISIDQKNLESTARQIQKIAAKIQKEYYPEDENMRVRIRRCAPTDYKVFTESCKNKIISLMILLPNGVLSRSASLGIVETSSNMAIVKELDNKIEFISLTRSSIQSRLEFTKKKIEKLSQIFKADVEFYGEYPAWEHNPGSELENMAVKKYEEMFGKSPNVLVMHCGLENGILMNKLKNCNQSISIGPTMYDVHTPCEYVEIDSVGKIYEYLLALLQEL